MTQRALAERLGIGEDAVSRIISGRRNVTIRQLHALADALRADLKWILFNEGPPPEPFRVTGKDTDQRLEKDKIVDPQAGQVG